MSAAVLSHLRLPTSAPPAATAPKQPRRSRRAIASPPSVPKKHTPTTGSPRPQQPLHPPPSSSSTALQCQHFHSCSGCSHEWDLDRPLVLEEVAAFFEQRGVAGFTFHSGPLWEWRCRAKLAVRGTPRKPLIGLYEEGTHRVVDIPLCRAHHPSINAAVELIRKGISLLNIEPYDEDEGVGELRYVQMAITTYNTSIPIEERYRMGKVQVTLVWNSRDENSPGSEKLKSLSNFLWRNGGSGSDSKFIHSIWGNFQTSTNNVIFGNKWRHIIGEPDFWERLGGVDICLSPSSFGQANTQAFDFLLRKLQKYVPYGSSVVDLYAGAGVIGLSVALTRKCRSVMCIEINKEAKISFEKSLNRFPQTAESSISWHHADATIDSLYWLKGSDVVIVDPPRKGLEPSLIDTLIKLKSVSGGNESSLPSKEKEEKRPWILRSREASIHIASKSTNKQSHSWPHTLIYISCGWDSFKVDCMALLSNKSWRLEKAHAFNLFPGTQSIEVLAVFKRGPKTTVKKKKAGKKASKST